MFAVESLHTGFLICALLFCEVLIFAEEDAEGQNVRMKRLSLVTNNVLR